MQWTALRRFWTAAEVVASADSGYTVLLDGKSIRTPLKSVFAVPTKALAKAVSEEWIEQGERVDPATMPQTRYVNSAIDGVAPNREKIVADISAYGGSELLCYRAAHPDELVDRQSKRWDPLLNWARERYNAPLMQSQGVMPFSQPSQSLERLGAAVAGQDNFALAALNDLVAISGSLVLGLAVAERRLSAAEAFTLSRLDEEWQREQWGEDAEAEMAAANKSREFAEAARHLDLLREE